MGDAGVMHLLATPPAVIAHNAVAQAAGEMPAEPVVQLEPAGMIVMGLSIAIVAGLALFCIIKILSEPTPGTHHHAPLDIDTHDREL